MASERTQQELSEPGMVAAMARAQATGGKFSAAEVRQHAKNKAIVDFDSVVWNKDDSFIMPNRELFEATMHLTKFRGNEFAAFLPKLENGAIKQLSFSKFTQRAQPFKVDDTTGEYVQDGGFDETTSPFRDQCLAAGTQDGVISLLEQNAGNRIYVADVVEYMAAVRVQDDKGNYVITGLKKQRLPIFDVQNA